MTEPTMTTTDEKKKAATERDEEARFEAMARDFREAELFDEHAKAERTFWFVTARHVAAAA